MVITRCFAETTPCSKHHYLKLVSQDIRRCYFFKCASQFCISNNDKSIYYSHFCLFLETATLFFSYFYINHHNTLYIQVKKRKRISYWSRFRSAACYQHIWNWNFPNEQKTARKSETFVIFSKLRLENVQVIQIDLRLAVIMFTAGVMMPTFFKLERSSKLTGLVGEPISLYLTIFMKSDEIKVWLLGYCMDIFGMVMSYADLWHFQKNF